MSSDRGARLALIEGMTSDEDPSVHVEHVVEISNESPELRVARRRSFATISVAVCLGLAGAVTAFAFVRDQSENAADKQRDSLQREQLLDGWTTLGAVAAQRAEDEMRVPPAPTAVSTAPATATATPAPVQNVIVVGSPATDAVPQTIQPLPVSAPSNASAPAPVTVTTPPSSPPPASPAGMSTPEGVPAPASAPDQTPLTPAPGSPDTVLSPVTYPASQSCGLSTCNVDSVCCNVSCGICTAPGASCSQSQCG